jgi:hypothetical protein
VAAKGCGPPTNARKEGERGRQEEHQPKRMPPGAAHLRDSRNGGLNLRGCRPQRPLQLRCVARRCLAELGTVVQRPLQASRQGRARRRASAREGREALELLLQARQPAGREPLFVGAAGLRRGRGGVRKRGVAMGEPLAAPSGRPKAASPRRGARIVHLQRHRAAPTQPHPGRTPVSGRRSMCALNTEMNAGAAAAGPAMQSCGMRPRKVPWPALVRE